MDQVRAQDFLGPLLSIKSVNPPGLRFCFLKIRSRVTQTQLQTVPPVPLGSSGCGSSMGWSRAGGCVGPAPSPLPFSSVFMLLFILFLILSFHLLIRIHVAPPPLGGVSSFDVSAEPAVSSSAHPGAAGARTGGRHRWRPAQPGPSQTVCHADSHAPRAFRHHLGLCTRSVRLRQLRGPRDVIGEETHLLRLLTAITCVLLLGGQHGGWGPKTLKLCSDWPGCRHSPKRVF